MRLPKWRTVFRNVHLWLGVGLAILIVPITLTGLFLVFDGEIDAFLHPAHYATTGPGMAQVADEYMRNASAAVERGTAVSLRWPSEQGKPVTVMVRLGSDPSTGRRKAGLDEAPKPGDPPGGQGGPAGNRRPPTRIVYLDPPTATVLGVTDFRNSLVGQVHVFHENLMVPEWSGRAIVGWAGAGLFLMSLTGLVIWLPRNAALLRGLAWRRGPTLSINLHHLAGFWIAVPLGVIAFTGIVLAFPPQASAVLNAFDPPHPPTRRFGFDPVMPHPTLTAQRALTIGLAAAPDAAIRSLAAPSVATKTWRLDLSGPAGDRYSVSVADETGQASLEPPQSRGDAIGAWMRRVHEGRYHGPVWEALAALSGLLPTLLAITGVLMWLRKRRNRIALQRRTSPLDSQPLVPVESR